MFLKIILLTSIIICCSNLLVLSQEISNKDSSILSDYMGYSKPGSVPEIFAPNVISTQHTEFAGTFSPDFSEYYFTRRGPFPNGLAQIMVSQKTSDVWTSPKVVDFSSNSYEFEPYITPDGNRLYFGSRRSIDGIQPPGEMHQWYLEKEVSSWSDPKLLGSPFFNKMVMYPAVSNYKTFYFTSLDGIYYSKLVNGVYQEPIKLGSEINFLPLTAHTYISPDESYLIFDGQPRGEGKTDIFISYKRDDSSWTKGKIMGRNINSGESQAMASVSPDGECLFFTRDSDIYWVSAEIIDEIKLIPEMSIEPDTGDIPLAVKFNLDLSTVPDSIIAFEWDLDNNGTIDSRLQNPGFIYSVSGIYSIKLNVFTSSDSASKVFPKAVEVFDKSTNVELADKRSAYSNYCLYQNYPNPFNPSTKISYSIPRDLHVNLYVFDAIGRKINTLVNEENMAGNYWVEFDTSDITSGIYFYQIIAGLFIDRKKLIVVK